MHIVHIAAEMAPFAKAGGLGDVLQSLPIALSKNGCKVSVIIPKYKLIQNRYLRKFSVVDNNVASFEDGIWHDNTVYQSTSKDNIDIYLVETDEANDYFNRKNIYGYVDDIARFLYFSRTALEFLLKQKKDIDVLHIHDWHTAITAPLYHDVFSKLGLNIKKIVFTIHNLEYQGLCQPKDLDFIGLNGKHYLKPLRLQDNRSSKKKLLNLLKGGLVYSDAITTVSPSYADEILYKEKGCSLDSTLRLCQDKLYGILNGIDTDVWNPLTDNVIEANYSNTDAIEALYEAKQANKQKLRKKLGMENSDAPLISSIGRLVEQKGPKLIKHAIIHTLDSKGQFILLGSSPIKKISKAFHLVKKHLKDDNNVYLDFEYDDNLAHLIFAASDFIIVPSYFEPCGLTQIIAFRYGTIPIVRKTGGLKDTVFDVDNSDIDIDKRNGYAFDIFSKKELHTALNRAIDTWYNHPDKIKKITHNIMQIDHSWNGSVQKYLKIYQTPTT
jgi:starch synthase